MRKLCVAYWLLLTALLLVRNPLGWFRGHQIATTAYGFVEPCVHFVAFALLGMAVLAARFPLSRWWLAVVLFGYAAGTEFVQGYVGRSPEMIDLVQNFAGIAVGAGIARAFRRRVALQSDALPPLAIESESWNTPRRRVKIT